LRAQQPQQALRSGGKREVAVDIRLSAYPPFGSRHSALFGSRESTFDMPQGEKNWQKATDRLPFFLSFKDAPCVGCGHATACGHPQLAAGSSFKSQFPLMTLYMVLKSKLRPFFFQRTICLFFPKHKLSS
jgi:hypothetical protein